MKSELVLKSASASDAAAPAPGQCHISYIYGVVVVAATPTLATTLGSPSATVHRSLRLRTFRAPLNLYP